MKKQILFLFTTLVLVVETTLAQKAVNVVALEYGATLLEVPPSQVSMTDREHLAKYSAGALFDQTDNKWNSKGTNFPFVFLIELAEEYNIQKFEFDNRCDYYPGIETKGVRVEFSTENKDSGFRTVGEYDLEYEKLNTFNITPQKTRWIRLSILSNHGPYDKVQLAEFKAFGVPGNRIGTTVDISGVWHTNWQDMTLEQNGNTFTGNYVYTNEGRKYKGTVSNGVIDRNAIKYKWDEKNASGTATLYLNQEGTRISGYWRNAYHEQDFDIWTMSRKVEESKAIEYSEVIEPEAVVVEEESPVAQPEEPKEEVAVAAPVVTPPPTPEVPKTPAKIGKIEVAEIKAGTAIVMENIFFAQGAAKPHPDSYPELDVLYEYLDANKEAKVKIQGHTDRIGDRRKNQLLSQARADAIRDYLVDKGIDKKQIETEGLGDYQTICPPPCEENRRVEFVLIGE